MRSEDPEDGNMPQSLNWREFPELRSPYPGCAILGKQLRFCIFRNGQWTHN
jgi:hypothetical protein